MLKAEIIAVGTELVSGQCLDTNSQWMSAKLGDRGISTHYHTTVGDDMAENVAVLATALDRADLIITSGGLGPTQDDLTRQALAEVARVPLFEDEGSLKHIAGFFERRNRVMAERNKVQALLPMGAEAILNRTGTAPGIWMRVGRSLVVCLPGVPSELKIMFEEQVIPKLIDLNWIDRVIVHRKINLFGRGESEFEALALDLTARGRVPEVGITASDATISFRISAAGWNEAEAIEAMEPTVQLIRERFAEFVIGEGTDDLPEAVACELARTGLTLALAESCTGGLIGELLTNIPGISDRFLGGVISYANSAKVGLLGVDESLPAQHGAVSPEVAEAMAAGARARFGADIALSVTGIAGPGGGSAEKPVGLVYLGLATASGVTSKRLDIGPEQPRAIIRRRAAKHALNYVRLALVGLPTKGGNIV